MFKRCGAKSLVYILALLIFASVMLTGSAKKSDIGQVVGTEVNMRSMPTQNSESILKLTLGDVVEVLEEVTDDEKFPWYRIMWDGRTGYIRTDMVLIRSLSERIGYVVEDGANLRGGPGKSAYVVTKMQGGKPTKIKQMVGDWYFVNYQGSEGFVFHSLIELSKQTGTGYDMLLKFGMSGMAVKDLQNALAKRNFIETKSADGVYGDSTRRAIKEFQELAKISPADGIAGPSTLEALFDSDNTIKKAPKVPTRSEDFYGRVQTIEWWSGGNKVLRRPGGTCTVYDVKSGKSFKVRRTGGTNHIDGAPITAQDTAIFKSILGGRWSHDKRPIIVVVGSRCYAASLYCMPHGPQVIPKNNYPGMLCIHFTNSRTHGGNRVDSLHKSNIQYVYSKYKDKN